MAMTEQKRGLGVFGFGLVSTGVAVATGIETSRLIHNNDALTYATIFFAGVDALLAAENSRLVSEKNRPDGNTLISDYVFLWNILPAFAGGVGAFVSQDARFGLLGLAGSAIATVVATRYNPLRKIIFS